MATKQKTVAKRTSKSKSPKVTIEVGNYGKHPFFVKKLNEAKAFIERVGLPKVAVKNGKG